MLTSNLFVSRIARLPLALSMLCLVATNGCAAGMTDSDPEEIGEAAQAVHVWPEHVGVAGGYVTDIVGHETHNIHDSSGPFITLNATDHLTEARTECASFITLLLKNTYAGVITDDLMEDLTLSLSPNSAQYYDAINPAAHLSGNSSGGVSLAPLDNARGATARTGRTLRSGGVTFLQAGDILAAKYTQGTNSGHTMTVGNIEHAPTAGETMVLTGTWKTIPGVATVRRWLVKIYDSTSSPHGTRIDTLADSRYQKDSTELPKLNDTGIGHGFIYLYEDATGSANDGQLVGWSWSMESSSTFQFTNPALLDKDNKTSYRPMMIGRFSGTGL